MTITTSPSADELPTGERPERPQLPCNLRDLGGLPTRDGRWTRTGVAVRSDDLTRAPGDVAVEIIRARGIRDIVDLRSHNELVRLGRAATYELPVRHHHLPMQLGDGRLRSGRLPPLPRTPQELGLFYVRTVEQSVLALRFALEVVADSTTAVLFHCVAGKDRAGLLAALLLTAAGVQRDAVVADFVATSTNLPALRESVLGPDGGVAGATGVATIDSLPDVLWEAPAEAMEVCLDTLTDRYGSPLAPLQEAGLATDVLRRLTHRLVEGHVVP